MALPTTATNISRKIMAAILAAARGNCQLACKILQSIADEMIKEEEKALLPQQQQSVVRPEVKRE